MTSMPAIVSAAHFQHTASVLLVLELGMHIQSHELCAKSTKGSVSYAHFMKLNHIYG